MELRSRLSWELLAGLLIILVIPVLVFYNIEYNPRTWHDEGAALLVARTLAEDGVYAVRTVDGYQAFGPVQSVGPTVIAPAAFVFQVFGVGLLQGRLVAGAYCLATLIAFYGLARKILGAGSALLALALLLGSPAARFLLIGRQVLAEVPAMGFMLAGWWSWSKADGKGLKWPILAGLLMGAAALTKLSYLLLIPLTLATVFVFDSMRRARLSARNYFLPVVIIVAIIGGWQLWQLGEFGMELYLENLSKLRELAAVTTGFQLATFREAVRFLVGVESGHLYLFWGVPSLLYFWILGWRDEERSDVVAIVVFCTFSLAYYVLWTIPWRHHAIAPITTMAIFVAGVWVILLRFLESSPWELLGKTRESPIGRALVLTSLDTVMVVFLAYFLQNIIRTDVLHRYSAPLEAAFLLEASVQRDEVVETWEREMGILTDLSFRYPDQSLLTDAHRATYRGGSREFSLGEEYFAAHPAEYVLIGWYARQTGIYDQQYLLEHATQIARHEEYELFKLELGDRGLSSEVGPSN
jgi:hypothetical protein